MGCGIAVSKSGGLNVQGVVIEGARACGYCKAPCVSSYGKGICDLCGATVPKAVPVWRCSAGCGFFSCATCELHLSMLGEDVKRLQAAAGLVDPDSASSRDAEAILKAHAALDSLAKTDEVQEVKSVLESVGELSSPIVTLKAAEFAHPLAQWEEMRLRLEAAIEGGSLLWLRELRAEAEGLSLKQREVLDRAQARLDQLLALLRLEEAVRESELVDLQAALASAREHGGDEDLFQRAQHRIDRLSAAAALASARDAWDVVAMRTALAEAERLDAVEAITLHQSEADLAKMEVPCEQGHVLRRSQEAPEYFCHGCYARSLTKELTWYRCDLCNFDLCQYCLAWRAQPQRAPAVTDAPRAVAKADAHDLGKKQLKLKLQETFLATRRIDSEDQQQAWFNRWASRNGSSRAQWELFRQGSWIPFGTGLSDCLTQALQAGEEHAFYKASSDQKHHFDFRRMEQTNLSTGKKRPLRHVLWEVELDLGWFLVEDDLALRLRLNELRGITSFKYSARDMEYSISIRDMEQVNDILGTRRRLRKIPLAEATPKMSRQQLRMAIEDDFPIFASAAKQWLITRWPWQELGDCSIDADSFIRAGLAAEIAAGLCDMQRNTPELGNLLQNLIWFETVDGDCRGFLLPNQVSDAIACDPRWRWGTAGAEDAVRALWSSLRLSPERGVEKAEFVVAGGLAEEIVLILNSTMESVDDWIMDQKLPLWEGQDCAVCFCPIGAGDVGRHMRCGCWLHFECLGHGLSVKISERAVDDEHMSTCPACQKDLGRVIPPGIVRRAVGEEKFLRYLDVRLEVQWQKEAFESGRLVARCPGCSFLVLCNEEEEMYSIKCLRQSCSVNRFCAFCSSPEHRPWTCEENERRNEFEDTSQWVRAQIEEALVQALHRRCTGCGVPTERTDACCHMTCSHCRAEFSWICGTEYRYCRANHPCLNGSIYLHTMPQLVDILNARGLECTDQNGSDLFLELRCIYLLSMLRKKVGDDTWNLARERFSDLLTDVIRGNWSVPWEEVGDVDRLTLLLPMAFPPLDHRV